jgi:large conductance mechanosensitive channel
MRGIAQEFKEFIMRGNVIDLAVAVVIGTAFGALVNSLVADLFTPLIAAIVGEPDFSAISFTINSSEFMIGNFINALIAFLTIAAVIFVFVVKPLNALLERQRRRQGTPDPTTDTCNYCKGEIPVGATRCMHCTVENPLTAPA